MIQLLAADLDETLLTTDLQVGQYTIQKIQDMQRQGKYFVCATGRGFLTVKPTLLQIGNDQKADTYTISLNGAIVTENKDNRILYCEGMEHDLVRQLYAIGLRYDVCIHVYTATKLYIYQMNEDEVDFLLGRQTYEIVDWQNLDSLKNETIIKILYENTNYAYLKSIEQAIPLSLSSQVDVSFSSNRYIEFNKKGVNKGHGLRFLCDYLHIPLAHSAAIGDNFNDLAMIQCAGFGFGVKNTHPDMLSYLDVQLPYTNNEDAVGHCIDEYILKN